MKRIFVLGSLNMDLSVTCPSFPKVGETVIGTDFKTNPGGKGENQAISASFYGAKVSLLGAVGNDAFGEEIKANLIHYGVDVEHLQRVEEATGTAVITLSGSDNEIIVSSGANHKIDPQKVNYFLEEAREGDLFLSVNEVNIDAIIHGIKEARNKGLTIIMNPAPYLKGLEEVIPLVDYFIPNEGELKEYTLESDPIIGAENVKAKEVIVTLGSKGVYARNLGLLIPSYHPEKAIDTTGAGDCFVGAFAFMLANQKTEEEALAFARTAASLSCETRGTQEALKPIDEVYKAMEEATL